MRLHGHAHPTDVAPPEPPGARTRTRSEIPDHFKWNLRDIFPDWAAWEQAYGSLERGIERFAALVSMTGISSP